VLLHWPRVDLLGNFLQMSQNLHRPLPKTSLVVRDAVLLAKLNQRRRGLGKRVAGEGGEAVMGNCRGIEKREVERKESRMR
jgi:hypothetical protein